VLRSEPGLNFTTFLAAIVISFPVCGLRPLRASRCVTEKEPKPTRATRSPLFRAFEVVSMKEFNALAALAFEMPAPDAIASMSSALFMSIRFCESLTGQIYALHCTNDGACRDFPLIVEKVDSSLDKCRIVQQPFPTP
jgi:hypothetical protein